MAERLDGIQEVAGSYPASSTSIYFVADENGTTFIRRTKNKLASNKVLVGGGTGLSAAALIYLHAVFATQANLEKVRQTQTAQWQQIGQVRQQTDERIDTLRDEVNQLKGRDAAYELLLRFMTTGAVSTEPATNSAYGSNSKENSRSP